MQITIAWREAIGMQQMMQDCRDGVAGLHGLARQEALAMVRAQMVSRKGAKVQMLNFASCKELGPVLVAFNHTLDGTQPLSYTDHA